MRPISLELEGFASFREKATIQFEGVDLFALTGPTGSGKSSVLDGIVFVLYGIVPRYGDKRLVEPAISQGKQEAKLRLEFSVGGDRYSAVRIVRRTQPRGASTKEARLEKGSQLLAKDEASLSSEVEKLLGLNYDQFTRCVMLPQGEFAKFLQDGDKDRNQLLRQILGIDIYSRMGALARNRASEAKATADVIAGQLERLADATPERREQLAARVQQIKEVGTAVGSRLKELETVSRELQDLLKNQKVIQGTQEKLRAIERPAHLGTFADRVKDARQAHSKAVAAVESMKKGLDRLNDSVAKQPSTEALNELLRHWDKNEKLSTEIAGLGDNLKKTEAEVQRAKEKAEEFSGRRLLAEAKLEALKRQHAAYAMAANLKPGDPCPVCSGVFSSFAGGTPDGLERAEVDMRSEADLERRAQLELHGVEKDLAVLKARSDQAIEELAMLAKQLKDAPSRSDVQASLEQAKALIRERDLAQVALNEANAAASAISQRLREAERAESDAREHFLKVRNTVIELDPPELDECGLVESWDGLCSWVGVQKEAQRNALNGTLERADSVNKKRLDTLGAIVQLTSSIDVTFTDEESPREACLVAYKDAENALSRLDENIQKRADLALQKQEADERSKVLGKLATELKTTGFEGWYFERTFQAISDGASMWLFQLSNQQYSLEYNNKDFQIVDHSNADERRPVRTLSGGETFLASLSLALALSDHIGLTAIAKSKLESLFLDEGFGTLDPDALDLVASAIEELGSKGRMIGVITHVREFAERIPVRYEVRKSEAGSSVTKVEA